MAPIESQHELALQRFLNARPALREELDHLNPLAAQAKGETMAQYRNERLHEAYEAEAERLGVVARSDRDLVASSLEAADHGRQHQHVG